MSVISPTKVLFLDVDGVLHPLRLEFKDGKVVDEHCFNLSCCKALQRVLQATGAEIVLSSSWRQFECSRLILADALSGYGLSFKRWVTTANLPGGRAGQILHFLQEHCQGVGSWAVVDDEELCQDEGGMMMQVLAQRFVRTDSQTGLTESQADELIRILNDAGDDDDQ